MKQKTKEKTPWYLRSSVVVIISLLGSLIGFASIASLLGVKVDDKLNKAYFTNPQDKDLFKNS